MMKKLAAYSIIIFILLSSIRSFFLGIKAFDDGIAVPFLIMIPATLSMFTSLLFIADRIHLGRFKLKTKTAFILSISLLSSTLLLMLLGKFPIGAMDTSALVPKLLLSYSWFPFLILISGKIYKSDNLNDKISKEKIICD